MHCEYVVHVNQISMGNKVGSRMRQVFNFDIITIYDVMTTYDSINWTISFKGLTCENFLGMSHLLLQLL